MVVQNNTDISGTLRLKEDNFMYYGHTNDFGWNDDSSFSSPNQLVWQNIWQWYIGQDNEEKRTIPLIKSNAKKLNTVLYNPKSKNERENRDDQPSYL